MQSAAARRAAYHRASGWRRFLSTLKRNVIVKARRRACLEKSFPYYEMLKNRLVFLDGGKMTIFISLSTTCCLGTTRAIRTGLEAMDALFQDFLREGGNPGCSGQAHRPKARKSIGRCLPRPRGCGGRNRVP